MGLRGTVNFDWAVVSNSGVMRDENDDRREEDRENALAVARAGCYDGLQRYRETQKGLEAEGRKRESQEKGRGRIGVWSLEFRL